jgi:putative transposase
MRLYKLGAHTKTDLKVHLIWIPKYRKRVLTGHVAIRARDLLRQIALEHEIEIITGKVSGDHIHMFISYRPTQNVSKIMQCASFGTFLDKLICRLNLERVRGRLSNQYFKERPITVPRSVP